MHDSPNPVNRAAPREPPLERRTGSLRHTAIRFPLQPRGIPAGKAARRLGVTEAEFRALQPKLHARGFPMPDPDTACFDLKAVDAWMDLQSSLTAPADGSHAPRDLRTALDAWTPEPTRTRRKG